MAIFTRLIEQTVTAWNNTMNEEPVVDPDQVEKGGDTANVPVEADISDQPREGEDAALPQFTTVKVDAGKELMNQTKRFQEELPPSDVGDEVIPETDPDTVEISDVGNMPLSVDDDEEIKITVSDEDLGLTSLIITDSGNFVQGTTCTGGLEKCQELTLQASKQFTGNLNKYNIDTTDNKFVIVIQRPAEKLDMMAAYYKPEELAGKSDEEMKKMEEKVAKLSDEEKEKVINETANQQIGDVLNYEYYNYDKNKERSIIYMGRMQDVYDGIVAKNEEWHTEAIKIAENKHLGALASTQESYDNELRDIERMYACLGSIDFLLDESNVPHDVLLNRAKLEKSEEAWNELKLVEQCKFNLRPGTPGLPPDIYTGQIETTLNELKNELNKKIVARLNVIKPEDQIIVFDSEDEAEVKEQCARVVAENQESYKDVIEQKYETIKGIIEETYNEDLVKIERIYDERHGTKDCEGIIDTQLGEQVALLESFYKNRYTTKNAILSEGSFDKEYGSVIYPMLMEDTQTVTLLDRIKEQTGQDNVEFKFIFSDIDATKKEEDSEVSGVTMSEIYEARGNESQEGEEVPQDKIYFVSVSPKSDFLRELDLRELTCGCEWPPKFDSVAGVVKDWLNKIDNKRTFSFDYNYGTEVTALEDGSKNKTDVLNVVFTPIYNVSYDSMVEMFQSQLSELLKKDACYKYAAGKINFTFNVPLSWEKENVSYAKDFENKVRQTFDGSAATVQVGLVLNKYVKVDLPVKTTKISDKQCAISEFAPFNIMDAQNCSESLALRIDELAGCIERKENEKFGAAVFFELPASISEKYDSEQIAGSLNQCVQGVEEAWLKNQTAFVDMYCDEKKANLDQEKDADKIAAIDTECEAAKKDAASKYPISGGLMVYATITNKIDKPRLTFATAYYDMEEKEYLRDVLSTIYEYLIEQDYVIGK